MNIANFQLSPFLLQPYPFPCPERSLIKARKFENVTPVFAGLSDWQKSSSEAPLAQWISALGFEPLGFFSSSRMIPYAVATKRSWVRTPQGVRFLFAKAAGEGGGRRGGGGGGGGRKEVDEVEVALYFSIFSFFCFSFPRFAPLSPPLLFHRHCPSALSRHLASQSALAFQWWASPGRSAGEQKKRQQRRQ